MATPSTYDYSISSDFPASKVATDRLVVEVRASLISVAIDRAGTSGDNCSIVFKDELSPADEAVLDAIVAAHTGLPIPSEAQPVRVEGPRDLYGKMYFSPNIFPDKNYRYLTGQADDTEEPNIDEARGTGNIFAVTHETSGDSAPFVFGFVDPVWIAGGSLVPRGAEFLDTCSMQVIAPATPVAPAPGGDGNCNLVDPGVGAAIMLVPAPGNGAFNVDLAQAVPIPYGDDWVDQTEGYCFWDWTDGGSDPPLVGRGVVTPNYGQKGRFNLFAIEIPLVTHARSIPLQGGDGQQPLTLAAVETKLVLPHWRFKVWLHNATGHAGLKVAFYLDLGRART